MSWKKYWRRRKRDEDFAAELEAHLDHEIDQNLDAGMSPVEARAAAVRKFGNITAIKERVHEMNTIDFAETFVQDVRHGLRWMRLNPGFSLVAILSLALGIGANTAIFQLIDAVRIRTLPVSHPDEIAEVQFAPPRSRKGNFIGRRPELTYPLWEQIQSHQQTFSGLFAWGSTSFDLSSGGEVRKADGLWVSGDFFNVLGVPAVRGRVLSPEDDTRGCASPGVVISHAFWQREFGGRDSAIGGKIALDGRPFDVIGVTPAGFFGMEVARTFDVALPLCARSLWVPDALTNRMEWWLAVAGRLKGGVSVEQSAADLRGISPAMFEETMPPAYQPEDVKLYGQLKLIAAAAGTGVTRLRAQYETPLWLLLATTGLVLLIACANIANLMLARANSRQREISIRLAIGASRTRLVRQLFAESLLLSVMGAALGAFLAQTLSRFLVLFLSSDVNRLTLPIQMDWRILAYMAGLVIATCVIFGLAPAIRGTSVGPGAAMKAAGRGLTLDRNRFAARRILVISQVALSLVLLVGALLFARSLRNLMSLESGYRSDGVVFVNVDLQRLKYDQEKLRVIYDQLLESLKTTSRVDAAAPVSHTPMISGWNDNVWMKTASNDGPRVLSNFARVGAGYFKTVGTPLVGGRDFNRDDTLSGPPVAVVDETFVQKVLQGANPIGAHFSLEGERGSTPPVFEIVGVVANVKSRGLRMDFEPTAYLPEGQAKVIDDSKTYALRSDAPLNSLLPALTATIRAVHPAISVQFQPFETIVRDSILRERLMATLSSFFGLLAAALATIGLYGTLSYSVTQRQNEIGIRMALGADRNLVLRMILREASLLLIIGLSIGTVATLATTRTAATLLFGLSPKDPLTIVAGVVILGAVTLLASYLPARRAANLEPTTVLREE